MMKEYISLQFFDSRIDWEKSNDIVEEVSDWISFLFGHSVDFVVEFYSVEKVGVDNGEDS